MKLAEAREVIDFANNKEITYAISYYSRGTILAAIRVIRERQGQQQQIMRQLTTS